MRCTNVQKNSNRKGVKRRLVSKKEVAFDLKKELPDVFKAFKEAHEKYAEEIQQTPIKARCRGFEASLLSSKIIESIQKYFPENWRFAKYKRFTLRVNGYIILFKKLNKQGRPMNIKTSNVRAISNQLTLPLFEGSDYREDPILFFGYKKNKIGDIEAPTLVYIDEDKVKWTIVEDELDVKPTLTISKEKEHKSAMPKLRLGIKQKDVANK